MGRVQQFAREGKQLKPGWGVDKDGNPTTDPNQVKALFPFGEHKGYGLALIDEILAAFIGGSTPTLRSRWNTGPADEKRTPAFFFQCIRPEAMAGEFAQGRSQSENVKAVIRDILGHGNEKCMLPGQPEAEAAARSEQLGGLLFTAAEIDAFEQIAKDAGEELDRAALRQVEVG
jgi:L-2-hydroxycarboxylate dehydrogenase (NAD+)